MGVLETVMQMKGQGQSDATIIDSLRQQGVTPKEIDQALSQSQVKSALQHEEQVVKDTNPQDQFQGMQQSISQQNVAPQEAPQQAMPPSQIPEPIPNQQMLEYQDQNPPQMQNQEYPPYQDPGMSGYAQNPPQQGAYDYYPEYSNNDTSMETMNDIADQVVEEKTRDVNDKVLNVIKVQEEIAINLERLNARVFKIENILEELQMAIIGKIGDFGKNIQDIKTEMISSQDSFSKILNPLTDNIREMQKLNGNEATRPKPKTSKKTDSNQFEDFLR